ncbi:hypothetical protein RR48_06038 [Papilio machaon]|uniref:Protein NRDE2-like n=1 Tax=Papilio machaon TaxID=76193 RepID=A0A194RE24_PAPMA|nr:hypothetical protein RR48_06038 [Papilio machaon]
MALFPAYSARSLEEGDDDAARWPSENDDAVEEELLASDTEEEMDTSPETEAEPAKNDDYYVDCKMDNGNRRVSTLYYPGRPQYERSWYRLGEADGEGGQRPRPRRYFRQRVPDSTDASEIHERAATLRKSLDDSPHDTELWERYIDFMETYGGEKDVIDAVELAITKNRRSRRVRMRWYSIMRRNLPPQPYAERLRQCLAKDWSKDNQWFPIPTEQDLNLRLELWLQLMQASGAAAEIGAVTALASAALHDTRALPRAYPDLLYAYGVWVRAAGLWEQLVQLIELVAAMNFPRAAFPPPRDLARERCREMKLRNIEDKIIESGLPLPTVWVRVERARAAAHWRPYLPAGKEEAGPSGEGAGPGGEGAGPGAAEACPLDDGGDPQRSPLPHDVAELLQPVVDPHQLFRLSVRLLMLAKVPLLCGSGWSMRGSCGAGGAGGDFECGEELLGALSTARALPPRHAAFITPDIAQRMLALFIDPPHYFTDEYGYLTWVNSLWEACCGWASGVRRTALLCWRLRWLRALLLVAHAGSAPAATGADSATADAEIRRMRADAQCILRRLAGSAPLPFAEWARLEAAVGGVTGATRAARHALRAAIDERDIPHHHCEEKCNELQHESRSEELGQGQGQGAGDVFEEDELSVLLPAPAEWGAVRALLYSPWHRARVLTALIGQPYTGESAAGGRFWEQQATALAAAAGSAAAARALAHYCPHSYYLNIGLLILLK